MAFDVPSIYTAIGALVFAINTNTLYHVEDGVKSNFTNHLQESRRDVLLYRSKRSISEKTCRDMNRCGTFYRKCHCDNLCHDYKDCCWDAPNMSRPLYDSSERSCVKLDKPDELYLVVSGCPGNYANVEIDAKCTKNMPQNDTDPAMIVPVFDRLTKNIYQNRYCALCNGVSEIVPYDVFVEGFEEGCKRPDTSLPIEVLKYFLSENSSCSIVFTTLEATNQRPCYTHLISKCFFDNSSLKDECESGALNPVYVIVTIDMDQATSKTLEFRNYHCYECSKEYPAGIISCNEGSSYGTFPMRVLVDASALFATSWKNGNSLCGAGQIYDPVYVRHLYILIIYYFKIALLHSTI